MRLGRKVRTREGWDWKTKSAFLAMMKPHSDNVGDRDTQSSTLRQSIVGLHNVSILGRFLKRNKQNRKIFQQLFFSFLLLFFYFCLHYVSVYKAKDIQDQGTKDYICKIGSLPVTDRVGENQSCCIVQCIVQQLQLKKCLHMLRTDHRELVKLGWWWVVFR